MSSVEFDADSAGGLMTKIQALIAPPENEETSKGGRRKEGLDLHPYYKRPGKGHNRDCCDACSEGGNLICCDKCPASFHLGCHDPPLEDEDIPLGQWLCHKCRVSTGLPPLREILKKPKGNSEAAAEVAKEEPANDISLKGRSRTSSTASLESNKSRGRGKAALAAVATAAAAAYNSGSITTASVAAGPDRQNALDTLIAAASSMNPTQFDLPREMVLPINFPGTDRVPTRGKKASASKRSRTHELDNGLVPLPAKTCFECRKSCKRAPLLACDYCPLLFHLDCLDPPLTSLPCGRWMCPNHVEQAIDERLLTSLSVTQRVALWDKYTGPINQDAVKTEFLQKARRQNPPFRFKVKLAPRNRAKVPNAVKELYKNRPALVPTLRDVLRENEITSHWADNNFDSIELKSKDLGIEGPTETEQEEWLSGIIALQTSIACHLFSKKKKEPDGSVKDHQNDLSDLKSELSHAKEETRTKRKSLNASKTFSDSNENSVSNGLSENHEASCTGNERAGNVLHVACINGETLSNLSKSDLLTSEAQNGGLECLEKMDCESVELADTVKVFDSKEGKNVEVKRLHTEKTLPEILSSVLEDDLDLSVHDFCIDKLDERLIRVLALQRLQQLAQTEKPIRENLTLSTKAHLSDAPKQSAFWPSPDSGLKPRALLTPLNGSQPPMPIYYRVMEIGTGGDMDICLSYYGHCNYVTAKHAVIICDEVNRHYELMNYSEHGTTVDNVLYSCDFSEKLPLKEPTHSPLPSPHHHGRRSGGNSAASGSGNVAESAEADVEVPPLIQKIRAVVDKRRGVVREENVVQEPLNMPVDIGKVNVKCSCRSSSSSLIGGSGAGWEGTALLNHGSFIKFGCIQFTFSVLNFVTPPQKELSSQDSNSSIMQCIDRGAIPQRILKRERDSTSSSTLTVSPSPPPDKMVLVEGAARLSREVGEDEEEENDDDDNSNDDADDKDQLNYESDREEHDEYDNSVEEVTHEELDEDEEMEECSVDVQKEPDLFFPTDSSGGAGGTGDVCSSV